MARQKKQANKNVETVAQEQQYNVPQQNGETRKMSETELGEMTLEEVGQALEEAQVQSDGKVAAKKATKKSKPAQEVQMIVPVAVDWTNETEPFEETINLSNLFPLDATNIPFSKRAMREIVRSNVDTLKMAYNNYEQGVDGATCPPPIDVFYMSNGTFVPWDGNHRWTALSENLAEAIGLDPSDKKYTMNEAYVEAAQSEHVRVRITPLVDGHVPTTRDLIKMAFTANFTHGLAASTYGRTSYAIWLMSDAAERGEKLRQRDACALAGVGETALSMALKRERDKASKDEKQPATLGYLAPEDSERLDEFSEASDIKESDDKLTNALKRLISTAKFLYDQLGDDPTSLHIILKEHVSGDETVSALDFVSRGTHRPW